MKGIIFIFWIIIFSLKGYSQGRYGPLLNDDCFIHLTSRSGTFYVGIENYIQLNKEYFPGINSMEVETNNGISFKEGDSLAFIPERYGSIRIVFKNRGKSIGYKVFNVKNVPDPKIKIGKHELLKPLIYIPQTELLNADSLSVFVSYDIINSENWYSIKEYTFGYTYAVFYYSASNTGNKISSEIKEMIEKAGKDKLISINAIIESNSLIIKQLPIIKIVAY